MRRRFLRARSIPDLGGSSFWSQGHKSISRFGGLSGHLECHSCAGPFIAFSPEENALSIQLFLILISMPLMFLAAVSQELARAQEKAKENEDQLTMALNAAQMGTWDWHLKEGEVKWSEYSKRMFGLRPTDPEGPPEVFFSMIHPEDRSAVEQAINRSLSSGTPYESEFRMAQPDGSFRGSMAWVRFCSTTSESQCG
jgi:PAS domain-containing protein